MPVRSPRVETPPCDKCARAIPRVVPVVPYPFAAGASDAGIKQRSLITHPPPPTQCYGIYAIIAQNDELRAIFFFALKSVIVIPIGNASNGVKLLLPASEDRRFRILSSQATELPRNRGKAGYHWNVAFFFFFLLQTSGLFTGASVARYVLPSRFPPVWQRTLVLGRQPVCASSSATASPGPSP